jgi:hypothetical protein
VTLVLVIEASDGLLLLADGCTTYTDGTVDLDTVKILPVPGAPIGVLLTGRSSYNREVVVRSCDRFL